MTQSTDISMKDERSLKDERFLIYLRSGEIEIWNGETLSENLVYKYQAMGLDKEVIIEDLSNFFTCIVNREERAIQWAISWGIEYIPHLLH